MDNRAELRKRERREAYGVYVRLQWALYDLPRDHPALVALREAVGRAERHWRALMPRAGATPAERPTAGPAESADALISVAFSAAPPRLAHVPLGALLGGAIRPPAFPSGPARFGERRH